MRNRDGLSSSPSSDLFIIFLLASNLSSEKTGKDVSDDTLVEEIALSREEKPRLTVHEDSFNDTFSVKERILSLFRDSELDGKN